jgi:hypothetical protein
MEPTPDTDGSEREEREPEENDAAWVVVETRLRADELLRFCQDVERLFRINPAYVFRRWESVGDGVFRWAALNESNDREIDTQLSVECLADSIAVTYATGLKTRTTFRVVAGDGPGDGAKLIVTDDYSGTPEAEREERMDEVDTSLNSWGYGFHRYLRQWKRWSGLAPWRWYMRRIWQPMRPMARRIVFLLIVITALEFVGFLAVFAIFRLNLEGYLGL